jgi:hypothetical protein
MEHPPYSPDLAPSDCYLFHKLKNNFVFSDEYLKEEVQEFFDDFFLKAQSWKKVRINV